MAVDLQAGAHRNGVLPSDLAVVDARLTARLRLSDAAFRVTLSVAPILYVLLILALFLMLAKGSAEAFAAFGFGFIVKSVWNPVTSQFGGLPFIFGTVVSSFLAILLAAPVGIYAAAYLAEFAPPSAAIVLGFMIELLAAVPSVVYGLWGLFVLAPIMRDDVDPFLQRYLGFLPIFSGPIYGIGMLTAAVILAIMILPTVTAITRDLIRGIPASQREGGLALGATRWETVQRVLLPYVRTGIFGAMTLALGRALGETIAVTMVIGNRPAIATSLFAPGYTLASVIANEFTEATSSLYISALIELGFLLFIVSVIVNGFARVLLWAIVERR
jgi:phosphate transport system permease protein